MVVPVDADNADAPIVGAEIAHTAVARRGETYVATAPYYILGYTLVESPAKLVLTPNGTNYVQYRYRQNVYGQITVKHYYKDGGGGEGLPVREPC